MTNELYEAVLRDAKEELIQQRAQRDLVLTRCLQLAHVINALEAQLGVSRTEFSDLHHLDLQRTRAAARQRKRETKKHVEAEHGVRILEV